MKKFLRIFFIILLLLGVIGILTREPKKPEYRRWVQIEKKVEEAHSPEKMALKKEQPDAALIQSLLGEKLGGRTFSFTTVIEASSGKKVLPLDQSVSHQRVIAAIEKAVLETIRELNEVDSPVRSLRRINEASSFFENGIHHKLQEIPGISCGIPENRGGQFQRVGYPDLRIVDQQSGMVFYLDPKLVEAGAETNALRTFYFEPKNETLKITDDAVHLVVGIRHDGKEGEWSFSKWQIIDLSTIRLRLKAEFQASNGDIYKNPAESTPEN